VAPFRELTLSSIIEVKMPDLELEDDLESSTSPRASARL
jgi:hypothetical protein